MHASQQRRPVARQAEAWWWPPYHGGEPGGEVGALVEDCVARVAPEGSTQSMVKAEVLTSLVRIAVAFGPPRFTQAMG